MRSHDATHPHDWIHRSWEWVYHVVEKLSVTKTIAISGGGGGVSLASAFGFDFTTGVSVYMALMGATGVTVSVGIGVLKWVQTRREMRHWAKRNPDDSA